MPRQNRYLVTQSHGVYIYAYGRQSCTRGGAANLANSATLKFAAWEAARDKHQRRGPEPEVVVWKAIRVLRPKKEVRRVKH